MTTNDYDESRIETFSETHVSNCSWHNHLGKIPTVSCTQDTRMSWCL
jgi:hypothetical protein